MCDPASSQSSVSPSQRAAIEVRLRRRDLTPRVRERLEMVKALAQDQDLTTIARWSGRSQRRIQHWLRRFQEGGMEALADAPRTGRPPKADAAYLAALDEALATTPRALGLQYDTWTSARLSAYLAEQRGVTLAPGWLRAVLNRRDYVTGRPKHTLRHLQDEGAKTAFAAELAEAGGKVGSSTNTSRAALPR
jgi:transposase